MTEVTKVPGIPTVGLDYRDPDCTKVLSIGNEAMLTVNFDGSYLIHPKTVAFGDSEQGIVLVRGWRGYGLYRRGEGTCSGEGWKICVGDLFCTAIAEGKIPLYSRADLPEEYALPDRGVININD